MAKRTKRDSRGFKAAVPEPDGQLGPISEAPPQTPSWRLTVLSFRMVRRYIWPVGVIFLIPSLLIQFGVILLDGAAPFISPLNTTQTVGMYIQFFASIWSLLGVIAMYYVQLRAVGGISPGILECYRRSFRFIPRVFGFFVLWILAMTIGLALLVVPGVIVLRRYFFAIYFLIDEDLGIREAMHRSATATKRHRRSVWSTVLCMGIMVLTAYLTGRFIPVIGGGISVLVTTAFLFLPVLRYQELSSDVRGAAKALR